MQEIPSSVRITSDHGFQKSVFWEHLVGLSSICDIQTCLLLNVIRKSFFLTTRT